MANLRLKHVQAFVDRHGHARHYFRRAGYPRISLPGLAGSQEFVEAYAAAMAGQAPPRIAIERTALPGTMRYLAMSYKGSRPYQEMDARTQRVYANAIDRLCEKYGDNRVSKLEPYHVNCMMAEKADTPESANMLRRVLRAMMKHAVAIRMRTDDPTQSVKAYAPKSKDGFHSWTEDEIAQFEAHHPIGSKARLALALLIYTGQRRSDIVRMGRQHIRKINHPHFTHALYVKQDKTDAELEIPMLPGLEEIVAATSQMTFLVTEFGKPFTSNGFGNWFRKRCDEAKLPQCSAHGLRKACARRLADAGCTMFQIAAITGHASLKEVQRYTRGADQKRLALEAMNKLTTKVSNLDARFDKTG